MCSAPSMALPSSVHHLPVADNVHERLVPMGYRGSERTTRRAVAEAKRAWRREHGRRTRP